MKYNKIKTLLGLMTFSTLGVFAQSDQVTITTVYDEPMKNIWNGGIYAGIDVQNGSGGIYFGANGRFTLGKIATFSTNIAIDMTKFVKSGSLFSYDQALVDQLQPYKSIELRGVFHFKDELSELNSKIKLGQSGNMKYSTNYNTKVRNVYGLTASLNVHSRNAIQNLDSVQIFTIKDANNNNPGYVKDVFVPQNNVVIGAGLHFGQYTWFKGKFSAGPIGTKTRRVRKSVIANFEMLYGLTIGTGDKAYKSENNVLTTYKLTDTEKRRLGFRISADVSTNKPGIFTRMEIGYRPGIYAPNRQSKYLNQAYIMYGVGFSF